MLVDSPVQWNLSIQNHPVLIHRAVMRDMIGIGCRQQRPKEWMSSDTWKAIESRRILKKKVMDSKSQRLKERHQEMYRAANKEVKRRTRADKRKYIENLASQAEEAAARNEQGTVYKVTKIITGKCHTTNVLVKDKNGILLTSQGEQ